MNHEAPEFYLEIYIQPGEYYWGDSETRIRTILGSCVAICVWHPQKNVGGMCHCLLPSRQEKVKSELNARYVDEAVDLILLDITKAGLKTKDFHLKLFGGGAMFKNSTDKMDVGRRNISMAKELLLKHNFQLQAEHIGGSEARNIFFDLWSGNVWLKVMKS